MWLRGAMVKTDGPLAQLSDSSIPRSTLRENAEGFQEDNYHNSIRYSLACLKYTLASSLFFSPSSPFPSIPSAAPPRNRIDTLRCGLASLHAGL